MGLNWSGFGEKIGEGLVVYSAKVAKDEYAAAASKTATNTAQMENNKFLYEDAGKQIISLNKLLSGRNDFGSPVASLGAGDKTRIEDAIRGLETTRQGLYYSIAGWEPLTEKQQEKNKSGFEEALKIIKEFQASGQGGADGKDKADSSGGFWASLMETQKGLEAKLGPAIYKYIEGGGFDRDQIKFRDTYFGLGEIVYKGLKKDLEAIVPALKNMETQDWFNEDTIKELLSITDPVGEAANDAVEFGGSFEDYGNQGDPNLGNVEGTPPSGLITQAGFTPEKDIPQHDPFTEDDNYTKRITGQFMAADDPEGIVTHGKDFYEEITPTNLTQKQIEDRDAWNAGQAEFNKYIGSPEALDSLANVGLKTTNIPQESEAIEMDKHGLRNSLAALIAFAEARVHGYDSVAGSSEADPDITRMTVGEIKEKYGNKAVGIGQFQYDFISDVANRYLDIKEKDLKDIVFSKSFQDQLITLGLEKAGITLFLKGEISQEEFQKKLWGIWRGLGPDKESLPGDSSDEYGNKIRLGGGLINQVLGGY